MPLDYIVFSIFFKSDIWFAQFNYMRKKLPRCIPVTSFRLGTPPIFFIDRKFLKVFVLEKTSIEKAMSTISYFWKASRKKEIVFLLFFLGKISLNAYHAPKIYNVILFSKYSFMKQKNLLLFWNSNAKFWLLSIYPGKGRPDTYFAKN